MIQKWFLPKLKTVNYRSNKRAKRKSDLRFLHTSYLLREWQTSRFFMSDAPQNEKFLAIRNFTAVKFFSHQKQLYAEHSALEHQ